MSGVLSLMPKTLCSPSFFGSSLLYPLVAEVSAAERKEKACLVTHFSFIDDKRKREVAVMMTLVPLLSYLKVFVSFDIKTCSRSHYLRSDV